jgi:hypothetical protein
LARQRVGLLKIGYSLHFIFHIVWHTFVGLVVLREVLVF